MEAIIFIVNNNKQTKKLLNGVSYIYIYLENITRKKTQMKSQKKRLYEATKNMKNIFFLID